MSKVKIEGNASGTGTLTIAAPNTNTDRTLDIPDAAGDLVVAEGGTFKINSSGNVGIGTSSPAKKLTVESSSDNIYLKQTTGDHGHILDQDNADGSLSFKRRLSGTDTERMRIDSSGNLLVGSTSNVGSGTISSQFSWPNNGISIKTTTATNNVSRFAQFYNYVGTVCGYIIQNGDTSTSYTTSSDYRLKTDVQPMTGATERLKALKPVNFEWISSGERVDGFLAHEAAEVVPEAVSGEKDAMTTEEYEVTPAVLDDDGNVVTEAVMGEREVPDYQGIDQSKLVPLLVATIQELEARIAALESN